ncbi:MAG: hypothetical protein ABIR32_16500 [Ilumatobacteraceae bacterium]
MPILHLLLIDASGAVVGQPTPRQWVDGVRLADGRRSIEIDGSTFTMEPQRMSVMELRAKLNLEPSPE